MHKNMNVFQIPNFSLRSTYFDWEENIRRTESYGHGIGVECDDPEVIFTQRQCSPLKYAADSGKGGGLKARPWGKLQGEKKKSCSARVFRVHKRTRFPDLSCHLLSSQEKRGSPRHFTTTDTALEILLISLKQWVSAQLGFSLTHARTCSDDISPNPFPLMWFIHNREFQLQ